MTHICIYIYKTLRLLCALVPSKSSVAIESEAAVGKTIRLAAQVSTEVLSIELQESIELFLWLKCCHPQRIGSHCYHMVATKICQQYAYT